MISTENNDDSNKKGSEACLVANDQLSEITTSSTSIPPNVPKNPPDPEADKPRSNINRLITVEPTLFLTLFALSFQMITSGSLTIDKICHVTYNYSDEICKNYTNYPDASDKIQRRATDLGMYRNLIEAIPAVVYSFFLGSWSDKHGRKVIIIVPVFGYLCASICNTCFAYFIKTPPEYLMIGSVFAGLSGGLVSLIMGCFSYIADITPEANRTKRIAIADLALFVSLPIGMVLSSVVYEKWSFLPNYGISLVILCISILYSLFFLTETIESVDDGRKCGILRDMFDVRNVVNNLKVITKKRKGNDRIYLVLMIVSMFLLLFPLTGDSNVMLLFVQLKFGWNQTTLGYYSAYTIVITTIGTTLIFKFFFKYKPSDMVLGVIGLAGMMLKNVIISASVAGWMLYVAVSVSFFQFIGMPSIRSFSSKLVAKEEVGKLFAIIASCESIAPLVATIVYSELYKASKDVFAGAIFLLSAGIVALPLTFFIWIQCNKKKHDCYKLFAAEKGNDFNNQAISV